MKKTISVLLLVAMLVFCMAACEEVGVDTNSSDKVSGSQNNTSEESTDIEIEVKDLGGREINILCYDFGAGSASILGYTGEVMYEKENSFYLGVCNRGTSRQDLRQDLRRHP